MNSSYSNVWDRLQPKTPDSLPEIEQLTEMKSQNFKDYLQRLASAVT